MSPLNADPDPAKPTEIDEPSSSVRSSANSSDSSPPDTSSVPDDASTTDSSGSSAESKGARKGRRKVTFFSVSTLVTLIVAVINFCDIDNYRSSSSDSEESQRVLDSLQDEGLSSGPPSGAGSSTSHYSQDDIDERIADLGFPDVDDCIGKSAGAYPIVDCDDETAQYRVEWHYHPGEYSDRDPESERIRDDLCDSGPSYVVDNVSEVEDPETADRRYELLAVGCIKSVE